jgi:hypothetical protein
LATRSDLPQWCEVDDMTLDSKARDEQKLLQRPIENVRWSK